MSTRTYSTQQSSESAGFLLSPSQSRGSTMKSKASGRQRLSRTLSRTLSLRYFHSTKPIDTIPKEISVGTAIDASQNNRKDISIESPKKRSTDCSKEIVESLRKLPGTSTSRRKNDSKSNQNDKSIVISNGFSSTNTKQTTDPTLMSPSSKTSRFDDILEDYERIVGSDESTTGGKEIAWSPETPSTSSSSPMSPHMLSYASPSRGVNRYASTNNLVSIHATPARRTLRRQASVYIPKADLDNLCNMYDDIVDSHLRSH